MNKKDKTNYELRLHNVEPNKRKGFRKRKVRKVKWNAKYKNWYKVGIMYNVKDKSSTE